MKIRPLIIDGAARAEIRRVTDHAMSHRLTEKEMMARSRIPGEISIGDDPDHCCLLQVGYRCVFSVEACLAGGWVRHLSVSVEEQGKWPNPVAMGEIAKEFGFQHFMGDPEKFASYMEVRFAAVNMLERMKDD